MRVGFVTENIANLGLIGNLFYFQFLLPAVPKVQGPFAKIIRSMDCIHLYLPQKFLSILQMSADSIPGFLSWTWSASGWLDTSFSHLSSSHSLCKDFTLTDCSHHCMSEVPNNLKPPSPWELLHAG